MLTSREELAQTLLLETVAGSLLFMPCPGESSAESGFCGKRPRTSPNARP